MNSHVSFLVDETIEVYMTIDEREGILVTLHSTACNLMLYFIGMLGMLSIKIKLSNSPPNYS